MSKKQIPLVKTVKVKGWKSVHKLNQFPNKLAYLL